MSIADDIALLSRNDEIAGEVQQELAEMIVRIVEIRAVVQDMEANVETVRAGTPSVTLGNYTHQLELFDRGLDQMFSKMGEMGEILTVARRTGETYIDRLHG